MAAITKKKHPESALSLMALKLRPNIFDISSTQSYASVRDQIVRARILARDLKALGTCESLLIVGAGVAGISAACAAARLGMKVLVIDTGPEPLSLHKAATHRYVGPHMYEWPAPFSFNQAYPSPEANRWPDVDVDCPKWGGDDPVSGDQFAKQMTKWLTAWLGDYAPGKRGGVSILPQFLMGIKDKSDVKKYVQKFAKLAGLGKGKHAVGLEVEFSGTPWPAGYTKPGPFKPDYIVLAAGMGKEETVLTGSGGKCEGFWEAAAPVAVTDSVAVFGGGDGAIQDLLLLATHCKHPLEFIAAIGRSKNPLVLKALRDAERELAVVDAQQQLFSGWSVGASSNYVDSRCEKIARDFVAVCGVEICNQLTSNRGELFLVTREPVIGRAYMLNRFVFHVVHLRLKVAGTLPKLTWLKLHSVKDSKVLGTGKVSVVFEGTDPPIEVDRVIVRWGISKVKGEGPPGFQMIGISSRKKATRTSFAQIPLPYVVPRKS